MTKVSILIPCYNAQQWVAEAVESALNQTYDDCEVICIDDGSTDRTLDILMSFGSRIRLETGPNRGGNVTRNRLLTLADGEWIQYLDADDYLEPDKVEQHLATLGEQSTADVLFGPTAILESVREGELRRFEEEIPPTNDPWELLVSWGFPQTGGLLWKRDALLDVGGWNEQQTVCQENELFMRLIMAGKTFERSTGGAVYRIWSYNTVCRRDPLKTQRTRLEITATARKWLEDHEELTDSRARTIAQAQLQCARDIMNYDRDLAFQIADEVRQSVPNFVPEPSLAFPNSYRLIYRYFGFGMSENLAMFKRSVLNLIGMR